MKFGVHRNQHLWGKEGRAGLGRERIQIQCSVHKVSTIWKGTLKWYCPSECATCGLNGLAFIPRSYSTDTGFPRNGERVSFSWGRPKEIGNWRLPVYWLHCPHLPLFSHTSWSISNTPGSKFFVKRNWTVYLQVVHSLALSLGYCFYLFYDLGQCFNLFFAAV